MNNRYINVFVEIEKQLVINKIKISLHKQFINKFYNYFNYFLSIIIKRQQFRKKYVFRRLLYK